MFRSFLRSRTRAVVCAAALLALAVPATALATSSVTPGGVISNGTVMLGVTQYGDLNYDCSGAGDTGCPADSAGDGSPGSGTQVVGIRFVPLNTDATADGCACEGWGVGDSASGLAGGANESFGNPNATPVSFMHDATTAVAVVDISDPAIPGYSLRVTQDYHPSPISPNLYEVSVSIANNGTADITDLLFRRAMDWDIEPTAYNEWVTIANTAASRQLVWDSDNGFSSASPLGARTSIDSESVCGVGYTGTCEFTDLGSSSGPGPSTYPTTTTPDDHGAVFDFAFGALPVGQTRSFKTYYGAAPSEDVALSAIAQQGIGVYSLGEPSCQGDAGAATTGLCAGLPHLAGVEHGLPNTFTFGFLTADADLSVVTSTPVASALVGGTTSTTFSVHSAGPDRAPGVHLTIPIPAGTTLVGATPSVGTCAYVPPNVVCDLGSLDSGADATVRLTLSGSTPGSSTLVATASSLASDEVSANDSATTVFTVTAAASPPASAPTAPSAPTVPTAPKKLEQVVRQAPAGGARLGVQSLVVTSGRTLSVGCKLTKGRVASCSITLVARSHGHSVIVGRGHRTFSGSAAHANVTVKIALTATGRALARRPGGLRATARSTIHAVGNRTAFRTQASTRIVLPTLLVLSGDLLFDTDSSVVKPAALTYIEKLKAQVVGAKLLACDGFTDTQGPATHNMVLGLDRARAVCALFAKGTSSRTRSVSLGEAQPRATNDTDAGRALNRRVEIHVSY